MAGRRTRRAIEPGTRRSGRKRWSEREARQRLEAWRSSGLNLMAWCRREGLSYERLRYWRGRIGHRRVRGRSQAPALLPVELVGPSETAFPFELELPRGLRLRVAPSFDPASLSQLLHVVEARP